MLCVSNPTCLSVLFLNTFALGTIEGTIAVGDPLFPGKTIIRQDNKIKAAYLKLRKTLNVAKKNTDFTD